MRALLFILPLLLSSCVTWKRCADKFGTPDTLYVTYRDTIPVPIEVPIPSDTIEGVIDCDSLLSNDTIRHENDRAEIEFWRDKYNKLRYRAATKPDTVVVEVPVPVEVIVPCPDSLVVDPEQGLRWYQRFWKNFQLLSAILVLAGIFWAFIGVGLRRLR